MTSVHGPDDGRESANVSARAMLAAAEVLTAERERVLRGTHHDVLDELLAASIAITALIHEVEPALRPQLDDALEALERAVVLVRAAMFDHLPIDFERARPRTVLGEALDSTARLLGFTPTIHIDDAVDGITDSRLLGHLVLSMRELLGNVASHAAAGAATVVLRVADGTVELEVADDGLGFPADHVVGRGLTSLRERAGQLGGEFEITVPPHAPGTRGTVAKWRAPLRSDRR